MPFLTVCSIWVFKNAINKKIPKQQNSGESIIKVPTIIATITIKTIMGKANNGIKNSPKSTISIKINTAIGTTIIKSRIGIITNRAPIASKTMGINGPIKIPQTIKANIIPIITTNINALPKNIAVGTIRAIAMMVKNTADKKKNSIATADSIEPPSMADIPSQTAWLF